MSVLQGKADLAAGRGILNNSGNNPEQVVCEEGEARFEFWLN
jgi:hypothetical protein